MKRMRNSERIATLERWLATRTRKRCWEWPGPFVNGYGIAYVNGQNIGAHRLAYQLEHGAPPQGLVCHRCDNPPCCNPDHLFVGTHQDNTSDAVAKGRIAASWAGGKRLTDDDVREIRTDTRPRAVLAEVYGIKVQYVGRLKRRQARGDVT